MGMGRMVSPLLARAAEEVAEQTRQTQDVLEDARVRVMNCQALARELGSPIQIGQPFSQSSSTVVINGRSSARVQAAFQIVGPRGSGVCQAESSNGEITSLIVNVNGRTLSINCAARGSSYGIGSLSKSDGDIIEAEIIDKN